MKRILFIFLLCTIFSASQAQIRSGVIATRAQVSGGGGEGVVKPWFIANDGKTIGWWIAAYESSVTKDENNYVTAWADTLGNNDITTYGGTPIWSSDGILFDGTNDYLKSGSIAVYRPAIVYICFKQITWTNGDYIFDGYSSDGGLLQQKNTTPNIRVYAGAVGADNSAMTLDTWGYAIMCSNSTSSYLIVNGTTNGTENFGTNNMNGITLAASSGASAFGHIQIKEVILRYDNLDSEAQRDSVVTYFTNRYGL